MIRDHKIVKMHRRNRSDTSLLQKPLVSDKQVDSLLLPDPLTNYNLEVDNKNVALTGSSSQHLDLSTDEMSQKVSEKSQDEETTADRKVLKRNQRINYEEKKKQANIEVRQIFLNQDTTISSGWLRLRNTIKNWVKLYCVAKPGLLILFKSSRITKPHNWAGTVMLNSCQILERPSKKDGFCFKLFHPLGINFWAKKGPRGQNVQNFKSVALPLSYLIIRAEDQHNGKQWIDALNCAKFTENFTWNRSESVEADPSLATLSPIIIPRKFSSPLIFGHVEGNESGGKSDSTCGNRSGFSFEPKSTLKQVNEDSSASSSSEIESNGSSSNAAEAKGTHAGFGQARDQKLEDQNENNHEDEIDETSLSDNISDESEKDIDCTDTIVKKTEAEHITNYVKQSNTRKSLGKILDAEKILNRVLESGKLVFPIECYSSSTFMDTLASCFDYFHLIMGAINSKDPCSRLLKVLEYNLTLVKEILNVRQLSFRPILGEIFRCAWQQETSKIFLIAECVSINPLIVCLHISNRKQGFILSATISISAKIFEQAISIVPCGQITLNLLERSETYQITLPYFVAQNSSKFFLETRGKSRIHCDRTNYTSDIVFSENLQVKGKLKLGSNTIGVINGNLNDSVSVVQNKSTLRVLWKSQDQLSNFREKVLIPEEPFLTDLDSHNIWKSVIGFIGNAEFKEAVDARMSLEEKYCVKSSHKPKLFSKRISNNSRFNYEYLYTKDIPWDPNNDIEETEMNFGEISTVTKFTQDSFSNNPDKGRIMRHGIVEVDSNSSTSSINSDQQGKFPIQSKTNEHAKIFETSEAAQALEAQLCSLKDEIKLFHDAVAKQREAENYFSFQFFLFVSLIAMLVSVFVGLFLIKISSHQN